jgi:hypothetical protein
MTFVGGVSRIESRLEDLNVSWTLRDKGLIFRGIIRLIFAF